MAGFLAENPMSFPDRIPPALPAPPGYAFPSAPGAAGVLTNDGTGTLSWQPAGGGGGAALPPQLAPDQILFTGPNAPFAPEWRGVIDGGRI
jgi:hypothetical protein